MFTTNQRFSQLFAQRSLQWGLRGDPFLWEELATSGETLLLPASEADPSNLLLTLVKNPVGEELAPGKQIGPPHYSYGGISSGMVSADFWLDEVKSFCFCNGDSLTQTVSNWR